jgi:hypothetical protein
LSNHSSSHYSSGAASNGHSFRRERTGHLTGQLQSPASLTPEKGYYSGQSFDFDQMIQSLHELFEHDRQIASQSDATRCGICYLHFSVGELHYREEGFYVCQSCAQGLGKHGLPMVHKQQKL